MVLKFSFLCTFKEIWQANFNKFLNTGQGVGQRGAPIEDNHFYLKIHAEELNFKHTCATAVRDFVPAANSFGVARAQNHKNFINFNHWLKIICQIFWVVVCPSLPENFHLG